MLLRAVPRLRAAGATYRLGERWNQITRLFDWLATLPMGAETLVSAGGSHLSAGQRQQLLLKALFASNYPLLLLDEASSQLDTGARERIRWVGARARTHADLGQHHP